MNELATIDETEDSACYPIRTVADLTHVNPITLRAWERRYGLFEPVRADRKLLFNVDHPDPNDPLHSYGVDDGTGFGFEAVTGIALNAARRSAHTPFSSYASDSGSWKLRKPRLSFHAGLNSVDCSNSSFL